MVDRMKQFFSQEGVSVREVCKASGIRYATLIAVLEADKLHKLNLPKVFSLLQSFPTLNPMWLLFGIGEMTCDWQSENAIDWRKEKEELLIHVLRLEAKLETYQEAMEILKTRFGKSIFLSRE